MAPHSHSPLTDSGEQQRLCSLPSIPIPIPLPLKRLSAEVAGLDPQPLAVGANGAVFRQLCGPTRPLSRSVVVKLVPDPAAGLREAAALRYVQSSPPSPFRNTAAARLQQLEDAFVDSETGRVCIVSRRVAGETLAEYCREGRKLVTEGDLRRRFAALLEALDALHRRGLYHLDVKADNVVACAEGGGSVLIDFGNATHAAELLADAAAHSPVIPLLADPDAGAESGAADAAPSPVLVRIPGSNRFFESPHIVAAPPAAGPAHHHHHHWIPWDRLVAHELFAVGRCLVYAVVGADRFFQDPEDTTAATALALALPQVSDELKDLIRCLLQAETHASPAGGSFTTAAQALRHPWLLRRKLVPLPVVAPLPFGSSSALSRLRAGRDDDDDDEHEEGCQDDGPRLPCEVEEPQRGLDEAGGPIDV